MVKSVRVFAVLVMLMGAMCTWTPGAGADGMSGSARDSDMSGGSGGGFRWLLEGQQLAMINYEGGLERLLLSVDIQGSNTASFWAFPVPAPPEGTALDIIASFPKLYGRDFQDELREKASGMFDILRLSQIYCILALPFFSARSSAGGGGEPSEEGVQLHESFTKYGVTAELISIPSSLAFQEYLASRGLEAQSDDFGVMDDYPSTYSWVVYWISSPTEAERLMEGAEYQAYDYDSQDPGIRTLGVSIAFPTEKMFFPLKPTSVYGNNEVPLLLYVLDHVSPEPYPEIEPGTKVSLYVEKGKYEERGTAFQDFLGSKAGGPLKYTKININAPSKYFVDDLWISPAASTKTRFLDSFYSETWVWAVLLMVLSSLLSALLAGLLVFRKYRLSLARFSLMGLWNFLTIVMFFLALHAIDLDHLRPPGKRQEGRKEYFRWRTTIGLTAAFSAIFIAVTFFLQGMIFLVLDIH